MLAAMLEAARLDPASAFFRVQVVNSYLLLNRPEEARAVVNQAQTENLDSPSLRIRMYQLAFLQHDAAEMAQQVAWSTGKRGVESTLLGMEANTSATLAGRETRAISLAGP